MKRVGLIDNLSNIDQFLAEHFHQASAAEVMTATGGNTGNVAFVFGARKILQNPITRVGWSWSPDVVRKRFDHLVICCANQVGKHADLGGWADRLEQFGLPVTLLGLGAQSEDMMKSPEIPDGTLRFLDYVRRAADTAKVVNIAVRGEYTQAVLDEVGVESTPAGCPSLHISENVELGAEILRCQTDAPFNKVAVAAGNPWHAASAGFEKILVEIVDNYRGEYVLQHPESMLQIAYGERDTITQKTIDRFVEVYGERFDYEGMLDWYRRNASVFIDATNWMRFLRKFEMVVGPRYHGVALALQAGVPGCVMTIDSRTQELCDGTAVKSIPVSLAMTYSANDLLDASRWTSEDAERFDSNRAEKAGAYVSFLAENGLLPSDQLFRIARKGSQI